MSAETHVGKGSGDMGPVRCVSCVVRLVCTVLCSVSSALHSLRHCPATDVVYNVVCDAVVLQGICAICIRADWTLPGVWRCWHSVLVGQV